MPYPMQGRDGIAQAIMANVQGANTPPIADNNIEMALGAAQSMGQPQPQGGAPPQGNPGPQGVALPGVGTPPGQLPMGANPQNVLGGMQPGMPQIPQMPQPTMPMPGQATPRGGGY